MTSTLESNKALVQAYFEAGNRDELEAWDAICSPDMLLDVSFMPPVHGLAGVKAFTAGMHAALSDWYLRIEDIVVEGDAVAVRWEAGGRQTGHLMSPAGPVPPTGKPMVMRGISVMRVADGKIIEERNIADVISVMQQLGVMPAPASVG